MNAEKTKRNRKAAATALLTVLALLVSPRCALNCSGADCRVRQTTSTQGEECHGASQTDFAQMRSAKIMVCDAPAVAARLESSAERLREIFRLRADTSLADVMSATTLTGFSGESNLRWGAARGPGLQFAETQSILNLRI
jgi:hypothetical protein